MNKINERTNCISISMLVSRPIMLINCVLVLMACALLLYYVLSANMIASVKYEISTLTEETDAIAGYITVLAAEKGQIDDPMVLTAYAIEHQMIPSQEHEVVFDRSGVAIR